MSKGGEIVDLEGHRYLVVSIPDGATCGEAIAAVHVALSRYIRPRFRKEGYPGQHGGRTPRRYPWAKLVETSETRIVYEVEV